jgi:hypothetical protein
MMYKTLNDLDYNVEQIKEYSFDHFEAIVNDLIKRGVVGYVEQGKTIVPSKADIKAFYVKITGFSLKDPA